MNGRQRNAKNAQIWGSKTTRIMMATVPHVTSGSGLKKFQADGFLFDRVYNGYRVSLPEGTVCLEFNGTALPLFSAQRGTRLYIKIKFTEARKSSLVISETGS